MSSQPLQQIDIGKLRARIRIQQNMGAQSASGAQLIEWVDVFNVWASIEPMGGNELFQAREIYPEQPTTITIRYLQDMLGQDLRSMRILWLDPRTQKDRQFDIKSVTDVEMRHYVLELLCEERPIERPA